MSKHPASQKHLFKYKDVAERIVCPNCKGIVKTLIPAVTVTYLIHSTGEICALENNRGFFDGAA